MSRTKESVISAMMFKGNASKLGFEPKEGDEVLIEARVSVYERRGNYQIYVNKMQLDGIGNLYQKLELLKKKLKKKAILIKVTKTHTKVSKENSGFNSEHRCSH